MTTDASLTPDQIEFTNAFNNQRMTLAGFAKCGSKEELRIVRDGLYLGLANDLQLDEYNTVKNDIVVDSRVADTTGTGDGFSRMIETARESDGWEDLVAAVDRKAKAVDSDIEGIWRTLETGRLVWLTAVSGAHSIKTVLKQGLEKGGAMNSEGDVSDAKMIWIYCICLNIPSLKQFVDAWSQAVKMDDKTKPFVDYKPELWVPKKDQWRPLDIGAQVAAQKGGSSIEEAWNA
jgi:hypothetical protein